MGGVIALIMSIAILYFLPFVLSPRIRPRRFNLARQVVFWVLCASFGVLMWIGRKPVEVPYELIGQVFTVVYFGLYFGLYARHEVWSFTA